MTLSAIHIESLNRKNISKYRKYISTLNLTNVDKASELGCLINILSSFEEMKLSYLSSSEKVTAGLEKITSELVLDKIFI